MIFTNKLTLVNPSSDGIFSSFGIDTGDLLLHSSSLSLSADGHMWCENIAKDHSEEFRIIRMNGRSRDYRLTVDNIDTEYGAELTILEYDDINSVPISNIIIRVTNTKTILLQYGAFKLDASDINCVITFTDLNDKYYRLYGFINYQYDRTDEVSVVEFHYAFEKWKQTSCTDLVVCIMEFKY